MGKDMFSHDSHRPFHLLVPTGGDMYIIINDWVPVVTNNKFMSDMNI